MFRGIDLAGDCLQIMAHALPAIEFRADRITLGPELDAAARANALVLAEGLSFREAYRRIAAELDAAAPKDGPDDR